MKNPQTLSIAGENPDAVIAIWGGYIINYTTQEVLTHSSILVDIDLFDLTDGALVSTVSGITMTYQIPSKFWTIPCLVGTDLGDALADRHKYVGRVSFNALDLYKDMREFFLDEFCVDNNSFEETLMRLPYEVKDDLAVGEMWIVWYDSDAHIGNTTYAVYEAPAYEGGTGTTYATDPSRVTHRGSIKPYSH